MSAPAYLLQAVPEDFPTQFALSIPSGRYAWTPEEDTVPLTFVWVKHYTYGKRNGQTRVRTQHGPNYMDAVTFHPTGKVSLWRPSIGEVLIGIYCDLGGTAKRYARELNMCFRCNTELTLRRSRYYGCGPECEKSVPWYFEEIDNAAQATYEELLAAGKIDMS
jgi:hypothetical protein